MEPEPAKPEPAKPEEPFEKKVALADLEKVFEYGDELLKQKRAERAKRQRAVEKSQRKRDSFLAARSVAEKGRSTVKAVNLPPSAMFFLTPS